MDRKWPDKNTHPIVRKSDWEQSRNGVRSGTTGAGEYRVDHCPPPLAMGPSCRMEGPPSDGKALRLPDGKPATPKPLKACEP